MASVITGVRVLGASAASQAEGASEQNPELISHTTSLPRLPHLRAANEERTHLLDVCEVCVVCAWPARTPIGDRAARQPARSQNRCRSCPGQNTPGTRPAQTGRSKCVAYIPCSRKSGSARRGSARRLRAGAADTKPPRATADCSPCAWVFPAASLQIRLVAYRVGPAQHRVLELGRERRKRTPPGNCRSVVTKTPASRSRSTAPPRWDR